MVTSTTKKIVFVAVLITIAIIWRLVNHTYNLAPNLELITAASVLAAVTIGLRAAVVVSLFTIIVSDLMIGNSSIFIFTWSSFLLIGLCAFSLKKLNRNPKKQILCSAGFAIVSSFIFFAITNFGVWLQGWYAPTWTGLTECFIMAIPFYRTMLIGNLILVPSTIAAWQFVRIRQAAKNSVVNSFVRD